MTAVLGLAGFERAEARLLELEMWAAATRLNLSDFGWAEVMLRSGGLEQMVMLAVYERVAMAGLCELAMAVKLNLSCLEREAARSRSAGLGQAAAGLRELGTQTAVATRLSVGGVARTGMVLEADVARRVAHRHRKTTRQRLSCVYVAEGGE